MAATVMEAMVPVSLTWAPQQKQQNILVIGWKTSLSIPETALKIEDQHHMITAKFQIQNEQQELHNQDVVSAYGHLC